MAKYLLSNKAVEYLASIRNYTFETWSKKQTDDYLSIKQK